MEEKQTTDQFFKGKKNNIDRIRKLLESKTTSQLKKDLKIGSQKITNTKQFRTYEKEVYEIASEKDECDLFGINYTKVLDQRSKDNLKVQVAALYRLNILQINS